MTVPIGFPLDFGELERQQQETGGRGSPDDARQQGIEQGGNIVELFPDQIVVHWRNPALTIDLAAGAVQNFTFWSDPMPWDGYAVGSYMELLLPINANLLNGVLRVGTLVSPGSQNAVNAATLVLVEFDPWFAQISGVQGNMVARTRPHFSPYGRRVNANQCMCCAVQVVIAPGVGTFNVMFDCQTHILNLNSFQASAR